MSRDELKVTVIVPIYNVGMFLEKCIKSICNQTYRNIEIILVDDGSMDESGILCDCYAEKDSRICVIHKENAGVSAARNSGLDESTGNYICFVDGDDYVMPDYVEYLLNLALKNKAEIALSMNLFSNYDTKQIKKDRYELYTGERATESILCYDIPIGVYNKIFKRDFLKNNIRFIPELCIGEGFNFNTKAFQNAEKIAVGHRKIYFYRKDNTNSVTTKFNAEKWINGLYAIKRIKKDFQIHSEELEKAWEFAWWRTNTDVYDLLVLANADKQYLDMYHDCKKEMRKYAFSCFKVPTSWKQRVRALIIFFCPKLIPYVMILRRKKYKVKVCN